MGKMIVAVKIRRVPRPSSAWAVKFLDPAHSFRFRVLADRLGTAIAGKCMVPSSGALRGAKDSACSG
jgi:hypothetical protein